MSDLLKITNLAVDFDTTYGVLHAVRGVSIDIAEGESVGIVGESGSGKTVFSRATMGLLRGSSVHRTGQILFEGTEISSLDSKQIREYWGTRIAMIFQDPMTALTPVYTVGWHIREQLQLHSSISKQAARVRAIELLDEVGIPDPAKRVDQYPHEYSGGMRQRAIIAMALSLNPALLIADEPTTALDVTIQAQILDLLERLRKTHNSSIIVITHDMGVVADMADEILVMKDGITVESGSADQIFNKPSHPYTQQLLGSVPKLGSSKKRELPYKESAKPAPVLKFLVSE